MSVNGGTPGGAVEPRNSVTEFIQLEFSSKRHDMFGNMTEAPVCIGEMIVVSVDRGEDMGRVIAKYAPEFPVAAVSGYLIRKSTAADFDRYESNRDFERKILDYCAERVSTRKLDMRLTSCEAQLDRRKIRVYYTSDERLDFRGLVRDLAGRFHARIEMRQIGVRDDARKKDGVGVCGRRLCCATYLSRFRSVTLKSIREQDLSPNPSKVSGVCNRLMCCLDFEVELYRKAARLYPGIGAKIRVGNKCAEVISIDIFRETVTLQMEGGEENVMSIEKFHRKKKPARRVECSGCNQGAKR